MEGGGCTSMATSGDWERLLSVIQQPDEKDNERVFAFEEEESHAATASVSEPDNESELGLFNTPSAPVIQTKPTPTYEYESHTSLFTGDTDTNNALGINTTEDIKPTPIYWNALSFFNNSTLAASALASLGALPTNDKFSTLGSKSLHEAVVITTPHYGNQEDKLPIVSGSVFTQQDEGSINMGRCVQVKPKYGRKFCKVEGCTSYAQKKGVCCRHGASFTKKNVRP